MLGNNKAFNSIKGGFIGGSGGTPNTTGVVLPAPPGSVASIALLPIASRDIRQSTLQDGTVLITGAYNGGFTAYSIYLYDPATSTWALRQLPPVTSTFHAQSVLQDGTVLITGGYTVAANITPTVYIYDAIVESWTLKASMPIQLHHHSQSTLLDGTVLVVGGITGVESNQIGTPSKAVYRYNPVTNLWATMASLPTVLYYHAQSTLLDGTVLVTGGMISSGFTQVTYKYDPTIDTWTVLNTIPIAVAFHAQSTLLDGRVLVTGGFDNSTPIDTVYVYDPTSSVWTLLAPLPLAINQHGQSTLPTGKVIITGGQSLDLPAPYISAYTYEYDPGTGTVLSPGGTVANGSSTTANVTISLTAGEALGYPRVVNIVAGKANLFDPLTAKQGALLGITRAAAAVNLPVTVAISGIYTYTGWGLAPESSYFAGGSGVVSSISPSSGLVQPLGVALNTDMLLLRPSSSIKLD